MFFVSQFYADNTSVLMSCMRDSSWYVRKHAVLLAATVVKHLLVLSTDTSSEVGDQHSCFNVHRAREFLQQDVVGLLYPMLCPSDKLGELEYTDDQAMLCFEVMEQLDFENVVKWCSVCGIIPCIFVSRLLNVLKGHTENCYQGNKATSLTIPEGLFENDEFCLEMQQQIIPLLWTMLEECKILAAVSLAAQALNG
jgi:hypothetical protein